MSNNGAEISQNSQKSAQKRPFKIPKSAPWEKTNFMYDPRASLGIPGHPLMHP